MSEVRKSIVEDGGHGTTQYLVTTGPARFVTDLTPDLGGLDLGPGPHDLACAALAACTAQTMRLYAVRKGWKLGAVTVSVSNHMDATAAKPETFIRQIQLPADLDEEQHTKLVSIANRCPIHRLLEPGATIVTEVVSVVAT